MAAIQESERRTRAQEGAAREFVTRKRLVKGGLLLLRWIVYLALAIIFLLPFIWMTLGSLRVEREIFANLFPLSWRTFVPIHWTLSNYRDVLGLSAEGQRFGFNFGRNLLNSFMVSAAVVASSLVFNTMGAYFFARLPFPRKNVLLVYVIATMLVPFQVTIVPLYIVVRMLGIQNSYWAMILPWYASPFVIFALIQFFKEIPIDLDEAALIDGASYFQILRHVIVPLSLPGLITMALLEFQFIWNLFFWPLIAVNSKEIQVIQVAISSQTTQTQVFWGRTFAGAALASLPVIIIFTIFQRYYVQGVAQTGIKG
ncbi:MAG TPA: carbohydrate ABC transporter permease [Candidatus Binatia bacterium]|jgi:ABC-type glycerol-3-phosphate transport system permease component|nr:carbohydrate ABC transporter permease [Candidatus Binatia bacterium]